MNSTRSSISSPASLAGGVRQKRSTTQTEVQRRKRTLLEQLNYMKQLEAQFPIAPLRVVYTKSGNTLAASVVTDGSSVIENRLYWGVVSTLDEGRYLCAVLNAPQFTEIIAPYQSTGAFGARDFDKYVWIPKTPLFDSKNDLHVRLASLAAKCEEVALGTPAPPKGGFQAHRKAVRDALAVAGLASELDTGVTELLSLAE